MVGAARGGVLGGELRGRGRIAQRHHGGDQHRRRGEGSGEVLGGAEGHTAIMARSLGLPAVLGVGGLMPGVRTGDRVVVDGISGRVFVNPGSATLNGFQSRQQDLAREREALKRLRDLPAVTRDGTSIVLNANIEMPRDVEGAMDCGAAGVGLLMSVTILGGALLALLEAVSLA